MVEEMLVLKSADLPLDCEQHLQLKKVVAEIYSK